MQLLFNADDFGLSYGVNQGIIDAYVHGVVRSTTLMTNLGDTTLHAIELAKQHPSLAVGIHLNMFLGRSLTGPILGCTDATGHFYKWIQDPEDEITHDVDWEALYLELEAQLQFALQHEMTPTHLDSHRHGHAHPNVLPFVCELAKKYDLKLRNFKTPHEYAHLNLTSAFTADFYNTNATFVDLQHIIQSTSLDSLEIMCHPAIIDHTLVQHSGYANHRKQELAILTSDELKTWLLKNHYSLLTL